MNKNEAAIKTRIGAAISWTCGSLVNHDTVYFLAKKVLEERITTISVLILNIREKKRFANGTLSAPMQLPISPVEAS